MKVKNSSRSYDNGNKRLERCSDGPQAKVGGQPLEAEKNKEMGSPLESPERTSSADTFTLAQ